jgi:hypothetical protein
MKKGKSIHRFVYLMITIICALFVSGCEGVLFPLPYRSLAPFEGQVVDAETKEPIEGAVVLGLYYYETYTIAGSNSHLKDGQETLTDKNGEFKLPRTRRWFVLNRGYPEGTLEIFKPGYGTLWHKRANAVDDNKSWPTPGKYIVYEIPKLKTIRERKSNLPGAFSFSQISYVNQKLFINAINEESINIGMSPYPIPKKECLR